jgi:hypothetical protein
MVSTLAVAMGLQHATARRLAVPDIPTNVLTTALTGLVAESRLGGGAGNRNRHRLVAPAVMFCGALVGATTLLAVDLTLPLTGALVVATGCLLATATGAVTPPRPTGPDRVYAGSSR